MGRGLLYCDTCVSRVSGRRDESEEHDAASKQRAGELHDGCKGVLAPLVASVSVKTR